MFSMTVDPNIYFIGRNFIVIIRASMTGWLKKRMQSFKRTRRKRLRLLPTENHWYGTKNINDYHFILYLPFNK